MTAQTVTEIRALVQAGDKGLAHLGLRRNTGTWVSRCGRQVRGQDIRFDAGPAAGMHAEHLGDKFCDDCRKDAIAVAGTVADGVVILNRIDPAEDAAPLLLDVPLETIQIDGDLRDPSDDLIASVMENGVQTPITLRRTQDGLHLVSGSRRYAAARAAGQESILAVVRGLDDKETAVQRILANEMREDLDPIARAKDYQTALEHFESQAKLAAGLGYKRVTVTNVLALLRLPEHIQEHVAIGNLSAEQGRELLRLNDDPNAQDVEADRLIVDRNARKVRVPIHQPDPEIALLGRDIARRLDVKKVQIKTLTDGKQLVINVANDADLDRILTLLGTGVTL